MNTKIEDLLICVYTPQNVYRKMLTLKISKK